MLLGIYLVHLLLVRRWIRPTGRSPAYTVVGIYMVLIASIGARRMRFEICMLACIPLFGATGHISLAACLVAQE